jgi:uncharacterized protein YqgC (DUF456 family)
MSWSASRGPRPTAASAVATPVRLIGADGLGEDGSPFDGEANRHCRFEPNARCLASAERARRAASSPWGLGMGTVGADRPSALGQAVQAFAVSDLGLIVVGLAIATGLVGIVVPVLPGALLAWAAIAVWALAVGGATAWAVLGVATLAIGGAQVVKVLVPGRRLRDAGVPRRSIVAGLVVAIAGFFLIPVVGFFIGFPLGVYLQERWRLGQHPAAWHSTRRALSAMGLSILIELTATVLAAGAWLAVVLS